MGAPSCRSSSIAAGARRSSCRRSSATHGGRSTPSSLVGRPQRSIRARDQQSVSNREQANADGERGTRSIDGTQSEQSPAATRNDPRKLRTITTVAHEPTGPAHSPSPPAAPGDVVEFLRAHPPFDALAPPEVELVAASAEVEFFRAGSTIFSQGAQPVEHLRVVRTGAVEIVLDDPRARHAGPR